MSHDYTTLITGSEDGTIYLMKLKEYVDGSDNTGIDLMNVGNAAGGKKKDLMGKFVNSYLLNTLTLIGKVGFVAKRDQIKELEYKIQNAKSDVDDEKEKLINYYTQKVKTVEEKNRDGIIKQKEILAHAMEDAEEAVKVQNLDREHFLKKINEEFDHAK